jgi:transaldolase
MSNPLARLPELGQSVYVDEIRRAWFEDGTLATWIERDGLRGVTSNPAIFQKAIAETGDYDAAIRELAASDLDATGVYETLVIEDIRRAADLFRPTFDASDGRYGWVSLEVSPHLARDADATVREARDLFARVGRPNVFIKVPGTEEGLAAIRTLLEGGIPVNVTLLFSVARYEAVLETYLAAMEARAARGETPDVASVASFFLSRIDVAVDPRLDAAADAGSEAAAHAERLKGTIAVANAKLAYAHAAAVTASPRWAALAAAGTRPQRLLWASTGTKNPAYSPVAYVEPLIGPDTVNTMPVGTLDAYRAQGDPAVRIEDGVEEARAQVGRLAALGIDLDAVTQALEVDGLAKFTGPFDAMMASIDAALADARAG